MMTSADWQKGVIFCAVLCRFDWLWIKNTIWRGLSSALVCNIKHMHEETNTYYGKITLKFLKNVCHYTDFC